MRGQFHFVVGNLGKALLDVDVELELAFGSFLCGDDNHTVGGT